MSSSLDSLASRVAQKWAREKGEFGPPAQRGGQDGSHQHTQLPQKKREDARRYKSTPKTKRDSKAYYHLVCKKKPKCMQRREEYRQNPEKYKRRTSPLREAASLFLGELRTAGDLILYDQENPANNEIKQPGANVGYEATSPINYSKSPDKKDGVPPSHALPEMHHDDANPSSSRVIPDSMKENLQDSLTYMDGGQHINASHRVSRKSAALISEIFQNCSPDLLLKSKEVQYDRKSLGPNGMSVWTSQGSKGDSYTIRVKPVPKSKSMKIVSKMPVQVSCSCPFFQWQGPEHWAKTHNYLYGKPVGSATKPSKKDPSGKHWACKHVLAVLELVRKQRFANTEEFSWEGELTPFPGSVFSPSRVASYAAIRRLIPGIVKPLFHATTGPRAGNIASRGQGIKANSGFSDFGGQVGISFSRDLSFLLAGSFGRYIFIVDENEISQRYVVKPYQHPSVPDEREERVYASVIPLSQIRGLIVNDKIYPFEAKELSTLPFPVVYKNKGGIWVRAS